MRLGVVRVETNGFLEEGHCLGEGLGREQLVVRPALEIGVVGRGVLRVVAGLLDPLLAGQADGEGRDNLLRDLVLKGEDILERAVIAIRPDMPLRSLRPTGLA